MIEMVKGPVGRVVTEGKRVNTALWQDSGCLVKANWSRFSFTNGVRKSVFAASVAALQEPDM